LPRFDAVTFGIRIRFSLDKKQELGHTGGEMEISS